MRKIDVKKIFEIVLRQVCLYNS